MREELEDLYRILQRLIMLHRNLLDVIKREKECLVEADLKNIHQIISEKEAVISLIQACENDRLRLAGALIHIWKIPISELTLLNLIEKIQLQSVTEADRFRSAHEALAFLLSKCRESNLENASLVERSLGHVLEMKKNIIESVTGHREGYDKHGRKPGRGSQSRLISREG